MLLVLETNLRAFVNESKLRFPYPALQGQIADLLRLPLFGEAELSAAGLLTISPVQSDELKGFVLQDVFKKANFGFVRGRTVLSLDEVLHELQTFILTAMALVATLGHLTPIESRWTQVWNQLTMSLNNVVSFRDDIKYHKILVDGTRLLDSSV